MSDSITSEILELLEKARILTNHIPDSTNQIDAYNIIYFAQKDFVERFAQSDFEPDTPPY